MKAVFEAMECVTEEGSRWVVLCCTECTLTHSQTDIMITQLENSLCQPAFILAAAQLALFVTEAVLHVKRDSQGRASGGPHKHQTP